MTAEQRLWSKITNTDNLLACWGWHKAETKRPFYWWNGKTTTAARAIYESFYGVTANAGDEIDHLCQNTRCCNPLHLQAVPKAVNIFRGKSMTAANARKTHCKRGHQLAGENLVIRSRNTTTGPRVRRKCRICEAAMMKVINDARYKKIPLGLTGDATEGQG